MGSVRDMEARGSHALSAWALEWRRAEGRRRGRPGVRAQRRSVVTAHLRKRPLGGSLERLGGLQAGLVAPSDKKEKSERPAGSLAGLEKRPTAATLEKRAAAFLDLMKKRARKEKERKER